MIVRNIEVPTGNILVVQGSKGLLECVSLGDYGKEHNLKADFMGLDRDLERVTHKKIMPLKKKWVITISSQYGCFIGCKFCDVPKVGKGVNASMMDMINQVEAALSLHPEVKHGERLNIHIARMGEPIFNPNCIGAMSVIMSKYKDRFDTIHPVLSTSLPWLPITTPELLESWVSFKNEICNGEAGIQLSINSTNEKERDEMFGDRGGQYELSELSEIASKWPLPVGRKYTLNFALAGYTINAERLRELFDPAKFLCKLTPMHKTQRALKHGIETPGDYTTYAPYREVEENLKAVGFDVIVFIASKEEDESLITCGNAVLALEHRLKKAQNKLQSGKAKWHTYKEVFDE